MSHTETPTVTYQTHDDGTTVVADISIDQPINGFFGERITFTLDEKGKAREAAILDRVKWKVQSQVGQAAGSIPVKRA